MSRPYLWARDQGKNLERCKPKVQFENHICTPRSVREWTHTLQSGFQLWELESLWSLESSNMHFRGQNSLDQIVCYTIKNFLKLKCLEWACMTHLSTSNINYGQKKSRESKCQFDSYPLKIKNCPEISSSRWCATYCWKDFDEGNNFSSNLTSIGGINKKLWAFKVVKVLILGILGHSTWESQDKMAFGCRPCGQVQIIL